MDYRTLLANPGRRVKYLERSYRTYNRKFFDKQLPEDTVVWFNNEIEEFGLTLGVEDEETKHRFFHIYIRKNLHCDGRQIHQTLIHEMAHIKLYPYMKHGQRFENEMLRLATRGALKGIW